TSDVLLDHLDRCTDQLDGTSSCFETFEGWLLDRLSLDGRAFVTGTSGDVLWGSDTSGHRGRGGRGGRGGAVADVIAAKLAFYGPQFDALAHFLDPDAARRLRARFVESLWRSFADLDPALGGDLATAWNLRQRQWRWGFSLNAILRRGGVRLENPFFDS